MARQSKLTPEQWSEVESRLAAGESRRAVAREYGVSEGAIRQRVPTQTTQQVRSAAEKLADARLAVAALPSVADQYTATSLADKLVSISKSLASAAELGAKTAHRLHHLANVEVDRVDETDPLGSIDALRGVGVLTKLANDSASIALNLLNANKGTMSDASQDATERPLLTDMQREALRRQFDESL